MNHKLIMENWRKYNKKEIEEGLMQDLVLGTLLLFGAVSPSKTADSTFPQPDEQIAQHDAQDTPKAKKVAKKISKKAKLKGKFSRDDLMIGIGFGNYLMDGTSMSDVGRQLQFSDAMLELQTAAESGDTSTLSVDAKSLVTAGKMSTPEQQMRFKEVAGTIRIGSR